MKTIIYKGECIEVRSDWWNDYMNSWLYTEIDRVKGYVICKEREVDGGKLFALERY